MPFIDAASDVHVGGGLVKTVLDGALQRAAQDLQFHYHTLDGTAVVVGQWFADEKVGAPEAQSVLPIDVATDVSRGRGI